MSDQDGLGRDSNGQVEQPSTRPITKTNGDTGGVAPAVKAWRAPRACKVIATGRFKLSVFRQPDGSSRWCLQDERSTEHFTLTPEFSREIGLVLLGPTAGRP